MQIMDANSSFIKCVSNVLCQSFSFHFSGIFAIENLILSSNGFSFSFYVSCLVKRDLLDRGFNKYSKYPSN